MPLIYFFCSGNSNRAQLAEGFARIYLSEYFDFISTSFPDEKPILKEAIVVMKEIGIDISQYSSPAFNAEQLKNADVVISICEEKVDVHIPIQPKLHIHISIEEPLVQQDYLEQLHAFRRVRDQLGSEMKHIAAQLVEVYAQKSRHVNM